MKTLFDKIWDSHVVQNIDGGPTQLYIDRLYCHEVTSPQAFEGLRQRGLKCFRPERIVCMPDHNTPTHDQDKPIEDPVSRKQVETLERNAKEFGLKHFGMYSKDNGIIHVVGPEKGLSLPGMTIVCGDSHTSTHGAMGAVAFGIGTSEVEMVMASQCILQQKPKSMRITINGRLGRGVTPKDVALYLMAQLTTSGATGYFVEYAGSTVREMSMEGRLTLCNLSIEMGARGGFIVDEVWNDAELRSAVVRSTIGGKLRLRSYVPLQLAKGPKGVVLSEAKGDCPNPLLAPANIKQPLQSKELQSLSLLPIRKVYEYDLDTTAGQVYQLRIDN